MENVGTEARAYQDTDLLLTRDGFPVSVGARRFRDMRMRENWDFLDQKMLRLLKENGFGYLKVDYNECIGAGVDGAESYGEGLRQAVCASQDYFRHIAAELPELVIENCSSGGHRLEPSMMALVSQASFSDAHEALLIAHTYAGGENPPVAKWMDGYREIRRFGSPLDGALRGAVIWCRR